jgi:lycopene cyclase domain-containing protein
VSYTVLSLIGVLAAVLVDVAVLRTNLLRRKAFWTSYAIVVFFQLIVNGLLTGLRIVRYDPNRIIGLKIVYAPVEDLLFGFAMIVLTLSLWVWWGRQAASRAARARSSAGR